MADELPDDTVALRRARAGDVDAYDALVVRYSPVAHRAAVLLGAGDDADDVLQSAFVKAFQALGRFRDDAAFRPWLLRIVANETHNVTRARRRRAAAGLRLATVEPAARPQADEPVESALAGERREVLLTAVRELREKDRLVITCRYFLDLSEAETATALGWPVGSVKSRTSRALQRLRQPVAARLSEDRHA